MPTPNHFEQISEVIDAMKTVASKLGLKEEDSPGLEATYTKGKWNMRAWVLLNNEYLANVESEHDDYQTCAGILRIAISRQVFKAIKENEESIARSQKAIDHHKKEIKRSKSFLEIFHIPENVV